MKHNYCDSFGDPMTGAGQCHYCYKTVSYLSWNISDQQTNVKKKYFLCRFFSLTCIVKIFFNKFWHFQFKIIQYYFLKLVNYLKFLQVLYLLQACQEDISFSFKLFLIFNLSLIIISIYVTSTVHPDLCQKKEESYIGIVWLI
jgi:hypothetical protein